MTPAHVICLMGRLLLHKRFAFFFLQQLRLLLLLLLSSALCFAVDSDCLFCLTPRHKFIRAVYKLHTTLT